MRSKNICDHRYASTVPVANTTKVEQVQDLICKSLREYAANIAMDVLFLHLYL
jgi:hypothetical protein